MYSLKGKEQIITDQWRRRNQKRDSKEKEKKRVLWTE